MNDNKKIPYNPDKQLLLFDDLFNCRDLGGMPLDGGKTYFAGGRFIRSSSPSICSEKACEMLKTHGVKAVIDLRSKSELLHYGNPFEKDPDVRFYNIPLFVGDPDAEEDPTMEFLRTHHLGDFYVIMVEELKDAVAEVMRTLIREDKGICLFHCAHGKDRTGVIAALLYLLAGANKEDVVTNYKISYDYARHFLDPLIAKKEDEMKHTLRSDEINMRILLDHLEKRYDLDIREYLKSAGMTGPEIDMLKARCLP